MTEEQPETHNEVESQPYVNSLQEWFGEAANARRLLIGWHVVSTVVVAYGAARYKLLVVVIGVVSFLVSSHLHYWRDELAPEMRHKRNENN